MRSRHPLVFISSKEESRLLRHLSLMTQVLCYDSLCWDCISGFHALNDHYSLLGSGKNPVDPVQVLQDIYHRIQRKNDKFQGRVFILLDFYKFCGPKADAKIERLLRKIADHLKDGTVIITGPQYQSNPSLDHLFETLDFPLPNTYEIENVLRLILDQEKVRKAYPDLDAFVDEHKDAIINAVRGLPLHEASLAFRKTLTVSSEKGYKPLDPAWLVQEKRHSLRRIEMLTFVEPDCGLDDVGGLSPLADWVRRRAKGFTSEAQAFGISTPKGVFLTGVPGGGKSLMAKAIGADFQLPLLRLDFGSIMNSLVGASEQNTRQAIQIAESLAPCVFGDAVVFDADGEPYTISDIHANESLFQDKPFYTYSFNESSGKMEKTRVSAVIRKRPRRTIEIVTANSRIRVTKDHKMLVIKDGKFKWKAAEEIRPNDLVTTPKKLFRSGRSFSFNDVRDYNGEDIQLDPSNNFDPIHVCYLLGVVDACGFIDDETSSIEIEADTPQIAYAYMTRMQSCFGVEPHTESMQTVLSDDLCVYASIAYASRYLSSFDDELIAAYLAGFLESSSHIQDGRNAKVSFVVEPGPERQRLLAALRAVGVVSPLETDRSVYLSSKDEFLFLGKYAGSVVHNRSLAVCLAHIVANAEKSSQHTGYEYEGNAGGLLPHDLSVQSATVQSDVQCSDLVGVRVISINNGPIEHVYDLSCEGNHNFVANNLVCHNCVLWIDEIDKALSASVGKGSGDSGTTKRVISTFLTWMSEKQTPVFIVATANNMDDIPPEFMRAGRFDDVFFVDLPSVSGRYHILDIMIRHKNRDPLAVCNDGTAELDDLVKNSLDGFTGAEIQKIVDDALFAAFERGDEITLKDIKEAADAFTPLSKLRPKEFENMRVWAGENARKAND